MNEEYLLLSEVAQKLRVSNMTIYRYIQAKKLRAYKLSKEWRIKLSDLNKFLENRSNIS